MQMITSMYCGDHEVNKAHRQKKQKKGEGFSTKNVTRQSRVAKRTRRGAKNHETVFDRFLSRAIAARRARRREEESELPGTLYYKVGLLFSSSREILAARANCVLGGKAKDLHFTDERKIASCH